MISYCRCYRHFYAKQFTNCEEHVEVNYLALTIFTFKAWFMVKGIRKENPSSMSYSQSCFHHVRFLYSKSRVPTI